MRAVVGTDSVRESALGGLIHEAAGTWSQGGHEAVDQGCLDLGDPGPP